MRRSILFILAYMIIGGLTPVFGKMAVDEIPWRVLAWARFGTAGVLLLATARLQGRRLPSIRRHWPALVGVAILCVPANQYGFLRGLELANASHGGIFYALNPVLVFWGALLLRQNRFRWSLCIASILAFAGAAAVSLSTGETSVFDVDARMVRGDVLLFLAIATWSSFSLLSRPLVRRHGAIETLSAVFLLGTLLHTPIALADLSSVDLGAITWRGWLGAGYLTLITSYMNYLLWYVVITSHDITKASVIVNANFVITVLVGWAFQHDPINRLFLLGCGLTLAGIALVIRENLVTMPARLAKASAASARG